MSRKRRIRNLSKDIYPININWFFYLWMSTVIFLLFGALIINPDLLVLIFILLVSIMIYIFSSVYFVIETDKIVIFTDLKRFTIPMSEIRDIEYTEEYFVFPQRGVLKFTMAKENIIIYVSGHRLFNRYIISPRRPDIFYQKLRNKVKR